MQQLATLVVDPATHDKYIEIVEGDITEMGAGEDVDVLIVSAIPNNYDPTRTSVIGALAQKGLSVADLAKDKAVDLRHGFSCWLSKPLSHLPKGLRFSRILCYEHAGSHVSAADGVHDIFRALAPFIGSEPNITSVAMPLVACGDQKTPVEDIVDPLLRASIHWMRTSPLNRVRIIEFDAGKAVRLKKEFLRIKDAVTAEQVRPRKYDLFLSYSHDDDATANKIVQTLRELRPRVEIFQDRESLRVGRDYLVQLDQAMRESARFLQLLSPRYLESDACQDEFNSAWSISERHDREFISPLLICDTQIIDPRMKRLQYDDSVKRGLLQKACERFLQNLPPSQSNGMEATQ